MLILYQPKNRRSIFCVPTKRLSKTVKPINAARETAMGSRSPAGPRRLRTETRTVRVSVPKALCFSPTFPRSMQRWQRMLFWPLRAQRFRSTQRTLRVRIPPPS